ncbi:sacsin N-terminal ATP-binding-like domain-containing protein [Blastococcus sp. PRF04-17]|uniref:sacsin N-terminal ATP-binding-like domain-containing protein n=1 Tax=Blastococcus sp. PRF04-17 TaxID=2933797 RepID=UPI001FF14235|nr:DEAD/DEAH box helicase family protein [Blastococcus sp. PRF04-17]UOY01884.1 DEAD/DEAH box helicase family protein [Blastococcus sp. PRF04-17]
MDHRERAMEAYRANRLLVAEHGNQEDSYRTGGYAERQLLELIQNAADALSKTGQVGRVEVRLVGDTLYCANEGEGFTQQGLEAVCQAFLSPKRGEEIGRFGLGFKSVLGVSDRPQVFSRTVSFGFDSDFAQAALSAIDPHAVRYPVLRTPLLLDPETEAASDDMLRHLMSWATTVVRLPLASQIERLVDELLKFPAEFLLFADHVQVLHLGVERQAGTSFESTYTCEFQGDHRYLLTRAGDDPAPWWVQHTNHRLSEAALSGVGEAIRRDEVRVSYAAPLSDARERGEFWAYFPLKDVSSTRGIINAPWQVNDDRTNLLPGAFNEELLRVVANMVVEALPELRTADDPARHFDYLPARGREASNFADKYLTREIPSLARYADCIPDADGILRMPEDLEYPHFELRLEPATHITWHMAPRRPKAAPHPSCYTSATRRARLRTLVREEDGAKARGELGAKAWIERLVPASGFTEEDCAAAVLVFGTVIDQPTRRDMERAAVVPDTAGRLHPLAAVEELFLGGEVSSTVGGLAVILPSFREHPGVTEVLREQGFQEVDPLEELRRLVDSVDRKWGHSEWGALWHLVDKVGGADARDVLVEHLGRGGLLRVRARDGAWYDPSEVVVAGLVEPNDPALVLDDAVHGLHLGILELLGVGVRPLVSTALLRDATFQEYRNTRRELYLQVTTGRRPEPLALVFDRTEGLTGLQLLRRFAETGDDTARLTWTRELLEAEQPRQWQLVHNKRPDQFPPLNCPAPHMWAVQRFGSLDTAWGPRPTRQTLARSLGHFAPYLPVALNPAADMLELVGDLGAVPVDTWREFLTHLPTASDPSVLGRLLAEAATHLPQKETPAALPAISSGVGALVRPSDLYLAQDQEEARELAARDLPHVVVNDEAATALSARWGCRPASAHLRVEVLVDAPRTPVALLDRYRGLRPLAVNRLDGLRLVECSSVVRQVTAPDGVDARAEDIAVDGDTVYHVDTLSDEELLERLAEKFEVPLTATTVDQILRDAQTEQVNKTIHACRLERDHAAKLLVLLDAAALEKRLPKGLLESLRRMGQDLSELDVARLFLDVHGYDALWAARRDLEDAGLPVPKQWAGTPPAIKFMSELGFPVEYAGTAGTHLDADVTVLGPPELDPLHGYQERYAEKIRELLDDGGRAMLYLPTGAGKTRVTVEAIVRAFTEDGFRGPLLWIAQSEELCEQAVQTWSTVWRQFGDHRPLRIGRLWSRNDVAETEDDVSVIVATDAKLAVCREKDDYRWLSRPSAVVIDEAHSAIGTDITATLRWLGIEGRRTGRPMLGLTATPFKGQSEIATERLAARFDHVKWDAFADDDRDAYDVLQQMGVLSHIEHRILRGSDFVLNADEQRRTKKLRLLPNQVLERIGRDEARMQRLLEDICDLPPDWPVLVFTASVQSAQVLAALLKYQGITSAAVSGATRIHERRRAIDGFKNGEIRVLTNCSVLTEGFDAPKIRALYVARPTFSPNAYIQMVGRGLRGEKNGGNAECLVVNVEDTFGQFGESLAYKEFDHLWERNGSSST